MSETTLKMRRQPTRVVCDYTWDAEPGECVLYRGWPHRLTVSRGRNKRDAGELTPVKITGPRGVVGVKRIDGVWHWITEEKP